MCKLLQLNSEILSVGYSFLLFGKNNPMKKVNNMKLLYKQLHKSNKGQTILFVLISIINVIITGVFSKLIVEINKIKDETQKVSRDEEMALYFSMLIAVSVMIIIFSLWIMRIICQTIFQSRKDFNIQIRLLGVTQEKLSHIYVREFFGYQIIAIPVGALLAEVSYYILSGILDISHRFINILNLGLAVGVHLFVVFLCLALTFQSIAKFYPLEEMRSPYKTDKIRKLGMLDVVTGIIGIILIVIGMAASSDNGIMTFLPMVGIFMLFDLFAISVQYFLKFIAGKCKMEALNISQRSLLGYYKRINPILMTLMVGIMISLGLLGMFETLRIISKDTVEQNIYFEKLIVHSNVKELWTQEQYEDFVREIDPAAEIAYGINLEMQDEEDINNTIYGIDGEYLQYGEKVKLVDGTDPIPNFEDYSFNGIYLPDYFISDDDIGKPYKLSINGNEVEFMIAGRFIANGSRGRYGFVSKAYMQSVMNNQMVNALYIHQASESLLEKLENNDNVLASYVVSKSDIANNSYDNAISGVEVFEISAFMIILISLLMFVHFAISTARQNVFDIARLRAMGVGKKVVRKAYMYQVIYIYSIAFAIGAILAYLFIKVGVDMSSEFIDVPVTVQFPMAVLAIIYISLIAISSAVVYFSTNKAFQKNITGYLTVAD